MKLLIKGLICTLLCMGCTVTLATAQSAIPKIVVDTTPAADAKQLTQRAILIAFGQFENESQQQPLGKRIEGGELVNYVQSFNVKQHLKGTSPRQVHVLSTGIEPLPDPENPLNKVYPGPIAKGVYVCFLKKSEDGNYYEFVGGWQGLYPIYDGKSISLVGSGFPEFNHLSLKQFADKIKSLQ